LRTGPPVGKKKDKKKEEKWELEHNPLMLSLCKFEAQPRCPREAEKKTGQPQQKCPRRTHHKAPLSKGSSRRKVAPQAKEHRRWMKDCKGNFEHAYYRPRKSPQRWKALKKAPKKRQEKKLREKLHSIGKNIRSQKSKDTLSAGSSAI